MNDEKNTMGEVKNWASIYDCNALRQAEVISRAPGIAGHVALMPDAHIGIGATVGSVIPTFPDTIIPAAVGVDIGCGMMACRTDMRKSDVPTDLSPLHHEFSRAIPAGHRRDHKRISDAARKLFDDHPIPNTEIFDRGRKRKRARRIVNRAHLQLGTLGSGNHFVEVCLDRDDFVWLLLHSGSRGIGNTIAQVFIQIAKDENTQKLEDPDTAALKGSSFDLYVEMMTWAQEYAYANRELMMDAAIKGVTDHIGRFEITETINCHHNFAALEEHFGQRMWITRKGAIRAYVGDMGIIPGSMGAATYIVEGKGNPDSYMSSAHGAGRMYSRGQAKRMFDVESLQGYMEGKAWNANSAASLLDEHPEAYKPIEQVMADQQDLVSVKTILRQILNYKGT